MFIIEGDDGNCFEFSNTKIYIYNYHTIFMVSLWWRDSCFNRRNIQLGDVVLINNVNCSSESFWSTFGPKLIGHKNIHTEEGISVQNQHLHMDQIINII